LPRVDTPVQTRDDPSSTASPTGTETILLVEDDPVVRAAAARILQSAGYRVLCAGNGADALTLADEHAEEIELVLTDVVMPRMSGPELARRLCRRHPGLTVLYCSGYSDVALDPTMRIIRKPFSAASLTDGVRRALDAG
jgi:DNA-binding NtrC family response regulator